MLRYRKQLTLRELLAATRLVEANLLTLDFTGITGNKACLGKRRLQCGIVFNQGTSDAMTNSTSLTRFATASHVDLDIKAIQLLNQFERLANDHATSFAREELIDRLAIDNDRTRTALHEHTSDSTLATAGTVEITFSHDNPLDFQSLRLLGSVRMLIAGVALQLLQHSVAKRALRQHAFNGGFQSTTREALLHLLEVGFVDTTRITGMAVVLLVVSLVAGNSQLLNVSDNDEITGINVRSIDSLVLAAKATSDFGGEAAEHLVRGVYHKPLALHLMWLGGKRFHVCAVLKKLGADWRKARILVDYRSRCQCFHNKSTSQAKKTRLAEPR